MRKMLLIVVAVAVVGASVASAADAEWPWWRGPNRDGKSPDTGLLKQWPEGGPKKLWQADEIGRGFSTVSVANGLIYTTGDVGGRTSGGGRRPRVSGKARLWRRLLEGASVLHCFPPGGDPEPGEKRFIFMGNPKHTAAELAFARRQGLWRVRERDGACVR